MRQHSRLLTALFGVLLATPMLLLGPATPAQAANNASLAWTKPLGNMLATNLVADLDGDVRVSGCGQQPSYSVLSEKFIRSGSVVYQNQIPMNTQPFPYLCDRVVDANGVAYGQYSIGGGYSSGIIAHDIGGTAEWYRSTPGCRYPSNMTVGANGNLYGLEGQCTDNKYGLWGVETELDPGETEPDTALSVSLPYQYPEGSPRGMLSVYKNGFVIPYTNGLRYLNYGGIEVSAYETPNVGYMGTFTASYDGRVFMPINATQTARDACGGSNTSLIMASINAYGPTGQLWSYSLPACTRWQQVQPTPDGGFILQSYQDGTFINEKLTAISGEGEFLWERVISSTTSGTSHANEFAVTLNGDVLVQQRRSTNASNRDMHKTYYALLSARAGDTVANWEFTATDMGYSPAWGNGLGAGLATGRIYTLMSECTWNSCGNPKLYALDVPGLEADYPRSAILKHNEPWLNYVAMGDSFSSGQGVTPYEAGTDTAGPPENRCRRSESAYAKLLNGLHGPRLSLADFVACGGSETTHVINGRFNEGPQINTLSTNTDVVTITIGGNDIGFEQFGSDCFWSSCDGTSHGDAVNAIEYTLPGRLDTLFEEIESKIGVETRVLVIGYPLFIPDPSINTLPYCGYLTGDEKAAARDVITRLNQELDDAVSRAVNGGADQFEYVDPNTVTSPFVGHELCQEDSYFNGVVLPPNDSFSFHPNAAGQDAYRQVIAKHLAE